MPVAKRSVENNMKRITLFTLIKNRKIEQLPQDQGSDSVFSPADFADERRKYVNENPRDQRETNAF